MYKKNKKILSVTIGIPAYNEELNIAKILKSLVKQNEDGFIIEKIVVFSDASDDNTVKCAEAVKDPRIKIIHNPVRRGVCNVQNDILGGTTSDVLVLLNADILPKNSAFIKEMVRPFMDERQKNNKIKPLGLVSAELNCAGPKTYFERILTHGYNIKRQAFKNYNNGNNVYMCVGCARAFSKDFYKRMRWKNVYGEDALSYFVCKQKGFRFEFAEGAEAIFRVPSVYKDHLRQTFRFRISIENLKDHFSSEQVEKAYVLPKKQLIASTIKYFFINPVLTLFYWALILYLYVRYPIKNSEYRPHDSVMSTKKL